jgi:hypothetical protein
MKKCEAFRPLLLNIALYGAYNDLRLLVNMKLHLSMISLMEFLMRMFYTYSINDRSKGWKGWLEDRRPAKW